MAWTWRRGRCLVRIRLTPAVRLAAVAFVGLELGGRAAPIARGPLHSWYAEAVKATWCSPQDIIVWVKFVGTHTQYNRTDVETVSDY
jgi:hypothetical protein